MPEAVFRIEIGGAGQGPSWCPDRNLPYKNCWDSWARKSRRQHNLNLPERFGSDSIILCLIYVNCDYILSFNRLSTQKSGARWENCDVANWWPSPKYVRLKSSSIKKLALSSVPSLLLKQHRLLSSIISCLLPSYAPSNMLRESQKTGSKYLQMTGSCSDNR